MSRSSDIKVEHFVSEINSITNDFESLISPLTPSQLNFKPFGNKWSVGQNVDHLIAVNDSYKSILDAAQKGTLKLPFHAQFKFVVRYLGNVILKSVEPTRSRKIKTFPIWEPTVSDFGPTLIDDFRSHQDDLIKMIQNSKKLIEEHAVIYSPANKNIVYTVETAFEIIVTHEKRHFEQASETAQAQNI